MHQSARNWLSGVKKWTPNINFTVEYKIESQELLSEFRTAVNILVRTNLFLCGESSTIIPSYFQEWFFCKWSSKPWTRSCSKIVHEVHLIPQKLEFLSTRWRKEQTGPVTLSRYVIIMSKWSLRIQNFTFLLKKSRNLII